MFSDPTTLAIACFAVIILGLSKGGFSGVGAMATPMFALVVPPVQAAAIMLPILILQDIVSVWAFRHSWNGWIVAWMMPGALIGIAIGYFFSAEMSLEVIKFVLGAITAGFALYRLWLERGARVIAASSSPGWVGSLFGVGLGFTSHIAHAGGPPFQIWVLPRKLPHLEYVGTSAIVFALVNWAKVPAYAALGEFSRENLIASAKLAPLAIVSTMAGVWLIRRIDPARFYTLIYWIMVALGAKLMWDGVMA
jgi:uncharacterized membrane protein YfcA